MENLTGSRIRSLRGETPGIIIADKAGISQAYFSQIELGQRKPSTGVLTNLAAALNTSVAYLMGETNDPRRHETLLGSDYPDATGNDPRHDAGVRIERQILGLEPKKREPNEHEETDPEGDFLNLLRVKVIDKKACCGNGNKYEDFNFQVIGTRPVIDGELKALYSEDSLLAVRAEGNSMSPEINDGDFVVFKFDSEDWSWGNQVVVCYNDALFVRGIAEGGKGKFPVILRSRRPVEYPDMIVKEEEPFNIVGRVIQILPASRKPTPVI